MTRPNIENLTLVRGDDWSAVFEFDQELSGFSEIAFTIRTDWATTETDNSGAVFAGTLTGGEIVPDTGRRVVIEIPNATTLAMAEPYYVYDMQVTTITDKIYTTQTGRIRMLRDATR